MSTPRSLSVVPVSRSTLVTHLQVNMMLEIHLADQKLHAKSMAHELLRSIRIGIIMGHPHLVRLRAMMVHNATFWRHRL